MFNLNRYRSERFCEKVEFKLSNLQAIKVPEGLEKLTISVVSVESGRTVAKTNKATVRSGNCQWTEIESIWVNQDEAIRKLEECQFKIIVSPRSAKFSILGEVTLNLGDYLNAAETGPLLLPLSDSGATLQVKIHCSNPKSRLRAAESLKETSSRLDELDKSLHNNRVMTAQPSENGTMMPSLRSPDSSKDPLEAAEETEELRDEAKIRERHSRQALEMNNLLHQSRLDEHDGQRRRQNSLYNNAVVEREMPEGNIEEGFQSTLLLKEQEIDRLRRAVEELEDVISNIQIDKDKLEEDFTSLLGENTEMSKILDDVEKDLEEVTGNMEFYISTNRTLKKKSLELEGCKNELELHVSQLEQENIQFSERICGLEAQLRHLANENETNQLKLENTRLLVPVLKDEIEQQKGEIEMQKEELKQKLQEAQKRLSVALKEFNLSRISNLKLQATNENLTEEYNSFHKLIGNLKSQKMELYERVAHLEVELSESKKKNSYFCEQVELLELKLTSLLKDMSSKEKSLLSQLERFFQEHKEHEERIQLARIVLNKIESEKTFEVENLQKEIASFTAHLSSSPDEQEKLAMEAVHEASVLRTEKAWLECSLQESSSKAKLCETDLRTLQKESKDKIRGLVDSLNASKLSEEMLMADIEHTKRIMEGVKSSEEKHRKIATDLEVKNKASDYEMQQLVEEISGLKAQLQKLSQLQDLVVDLKISLDEVNWEKEKVQEELKLVKEVHGGLKSEKEFLREKLSNVQKALNDDEDQRLGKMVLEEKLLRLESDLSIKEASYAYEAELRNEMKRVKRANSEYHRKVQNLELENVVLVQKMQSLEMELMMRKPSHDEKSSSEGGKNEILGTEQYAETMEENGACRESFRSSSFWGQSGEAEALRNIISSNSHKISYLETELRDMRERYLSLTLQYAEVEAEREEMAVQLKSTKKRWFS